MTVCLKHPTLPFSELPCQIRPVRMAGGKKSSRHDKGLAKRQQPDLRLFRVINRNTEGQIRTRPHTSNHSDRHLDNNNVNIRGINLPPIGNYDFKSEFMVEEITNLKNYVPKRKYAYLDRHFRSWIMRVPALHELGYELQKLGAVCLGDVVQMTAEEILAKTSATEKTVEILKDDLASVGLTLGMKIPPSAPFHRRAQEAGWRL